MTIEAGGEIYARYASDQVSLQETYKESLERRAMSVIQSSSTLAALLSGLVALAARGPDFRISPEAAMALILAATAFVVAAVCAIVVNMPRNYAGIQVGPLKDAVSEWKHDRQTAQQKVALTQLVELDAAKRQNRSKANWLTAGIGAESFAVALLAFFVALALTIR